MQLKSGFCIAKIDQPLLSMVTICKSKLCNNTQKYICSIALEENDIRVAKHCKIQ